MNKTIIQVFKNVLTGWGAVGLQAAIGLYMVPFLLGHLGKDGYGVIGVLMSVIGFVGIADLGLRAALNRELAEKVAKDDAEGFRVLSSSALFLYLGIASILVTTGWFLAPWFCSVFNVGKEYLELTVLLLRSFGTLSVVLSFITPVFTAGICSFMRYDIQNNISMFSRVCVSLSLFLILSLVQANPLIIWGAVMGGGEVIRLLVMIFYYRHVCFGGKISLYYAHLGSLLPLFKLGGSMYVLQMTRVISERMDPLIISRFIGLGGVALYRAGASLPEMIQRIVMSLVDQLVPLTTKYHVSDSMHREQQLLILGTKYTLYLGGFFTVGMLLFSDSFCHLWLYDQLGNQVETVALVMKAWALINFFRCSAGTQWSIIVGKKKMKFAIGLTLPLAFFNIIFSVYLVGFTKIGVVGVLVATVLVELIRRPISTWYVSRAVGLPCMKYIFKSYIAPFLCVLLLFVYGFFTKEVVHMSGWIGLLVLWILLFMGMSVFVIIFEWKLLSKILLKNRVLK